jgi:RimJ/RimL family protein N-acetyltransferase
MAQLALKLEPFTTADVDHLISWIPSAAFLLQWAGSAFDYPLDRAQLLEHVVASENATPDQIIFKAIHLQTYEPIGHGELLRIDRKNLCAGIARVLVGPRELRGRGLGEQIVRQLVQVAFEELHLHRISLHVFDFNTAAIRCYEKVGFTQEGTLRDARKHGDAYWNMCVMGMLEHEYRHIAAQTEKEGQV